MFLKNKKILLGISGGIAAYKSVLLLRLLIKSGADVQVVATPNALKFVGKTTWETLSGKKLLSDTFDSFDTSKVTHVVLGQDVDLIVIAPATTNTIAKAANGIGDNLLSTILLAATSPVLFVPGMNTAMYENSANIKNMQILKQRKNVFFLDSESGELACRDFGKGRMAEPQNIIAKINQIFFELMPKTNKKWVISAGSTKEYLDPIRFLTNNASGKTGIFLANNSALKGNSVVLVAGNVDFNEKLYPFKTKRVETSQEMFETIKQEVKTADVLIMSAAVADYTFKKQKNKIKKQETDLTLTLKRTNDILKETAFLMKKDAVRVGFAAETNNLIENARKKLNSKTLDLIIANMVSNDFNPFGNAENQVFLITKNNVKEIKKIDKETLSFQIIDYIERLIEEKQNGVV